MGGRGFAPKPVETRRNRAKPQRGEWRPGVGLGWQHGPIPPAPQGLTEDSQAAWAAWMGSWVASHWTPADLPGLSITVRLFDQVERGKFQRCSELRLWLNGFGLTPQGKQDRRWAPPVDEPEIAASPQAATKYAHLRAVPVEKTREPKVVGGEPGRTADRNAADRGTGPGPLDAINARLREPDDGDAS